MVKMGAGGSKQDLDSLPVMTMEEVQKHSSETDCWVVISGIVVDATKFLEEVSDACMKSRGGECCARSPCSLRSNRSHRNRSPCPARPGARARVRSVGCTVCGS